MSINIPERYKQLRKALPFDTVSIGYGSISLVPVEELETLQRGYGVIPEGDKTDWRDEWIVIGDEGTCGDPIFIDTSNDKFPVYTAAHGMGEWNPQLIASSFSCFVQTLNRLQVLAHGRTNPVEMKNNPITEKERQEFFNSIRSDSSAIDVTFWKLICESET